jgi:hypothetical protein
MADLTIDLDDEPKEVPQQLRHRTITTVLSVSAAVVVIAYALAAGAGLGAHPPMAAPAPARASTPYPRLIIPTAAAAGDTLIVIAYRNPRLCGPTELRFDGAAIPTRTVPTSANSSPQIFLSMRVPPTAATGSHRIDLYGPMPSTGGIICGDVPEHQGRLATAAIAVHRPTQRDARR